MTVMNDALATSEENVRTSATGYRRRRRGRKARATHRHRRLQPATRTHVEPGWTTTQTTPQSCTTPQLGSRPACTASDESHTETDRLPRAMYHRCGLVSASAPGAPMGAPCTVVLWYGLFRQVHVHRYNASDRIYTSSLGLVRTCVSYYVDSVYS